MYLWGVSVSGSAVASLASVARKRFGKPTARRGRRVVELSWRQGLDVPLGRQCQWLRGSVVGVGGA